MKFFRCILFLLFSLGALTDSNDWCTWTDNGYNYNLNALHKKP